MNGHQTAALNVEVTFMYILSLFIITFPFYRETHSCKVIWIQESFLCINRSVLVRRWQLYGLQLGLLTSEEKKTNLMRHSNIQLFNYKSNVINLKVKCVEFAYTIDILIMFQINLLSKYLRALEMSY